MRYLNEMNYTIRLADEQPEHFHTEIECLFVIEGNLRVSLQGEEYTLGRHDILLVNSGLRHSLHPQGKVILCVVRYAWPLVWTLLGKEAGFFTCNSAANPKDADRELQTIFQQLVYQAVSVKHKTRCNEQSFLFRLLDELIEHHMQSMRRYDGGEDARLHRILQYVGGNFQNNISLSALAEEMFVSTSTLSRFFKKKMGVYFADYLNQVRLEYAAGELEQTSQNVTQIAVDSGFSNLSTFNRVFRERYGMTPSDYRRRRQQQLKALRSEEVTLQEHLRNALQFTAKEPPSFPAVTALQVKADVLQGKPYRKFWNRTMNAGSISTLLMVNIQKQMLYLAEHLGFQYVRVWNIFSRPMMITDGRRTGGYQYDRLDLVFDFLVEHHLIPFLDMGVRPNAAVKADGEAVYFETECVQFASRSVWEATVSDFVRHIVKRYGVETVSGWIFEISCDTIHAPEGNCYSDSHYQHIDAFSYLYRELKAVSPRIQVGGPGAIVNWNRSFTMDFLASCRKLSCEPDFVSMFLFPYDTLSEGEQVVHRRAIDRDFEREQVAQMEKMLAESGIESRLYISEWNNSLSNRDYLNDSCFRAAYMVEQIEQIWDRVDMLAIWMASDWVSHYFDTGGRIANGGSGLLTKDMIQKPAYYALAFLNSMGDCLVRKDRGYLITSCKQQDFYILCYNYKWYDCSYFVNQKDVEDPSRIGNLFQDQQPLTMAFELDRLPYEQCVVKKRLITPREGMLLTEWSRFRYAQSLDPSDIQYIRQACFPRMSMERVGAVEGKLQLEVVLQPHEVMLIHIYRAQD